MAPGETASSSMSAMRLRNGYVLNETAAAPTAETPRARLGTRAARSDWHGASWQIPDLPVPPARRWQWVASQAATQDLRLRRGMMEGVVAARRLAEHRLSEPGLNDLPERRPCEFDRLKSNFSYRS